MIQIRHYWGIIARKAILHERDTDPWDSQSYFSGMAGKLTCWEEALPDEHTWKASYLRGYGSVGQDVVGFTYMLGVSTITDSQETYFEVTVLVRLCNIVLRRPYLHE